MHNVAVIEEIIKDVRDYKVDVAALQETMWNADAVTKGDRGEEIINFQSPVQGYRDLGFYMTAEESRCFHNIVHSTVRTSSISPRLLQLALAAFNASVDNSS